MKLDNDTRQRLRYLAELPYCNPFLPERVELEKKVLGPDHAETPVVWSLPDESGDIWKSTRQISKQIHPDTLALRDELIENTSAKLEDIHLYEDLVLYCLYDRYRVPLGDLIYDDDHSTRNPNRTECKKAWSEFQADFNQFIDIGPHSKHFRFLTDAKHVWSCIFQIRRLFHYIFYWVVGTSPAAARLRACIWQSVMTHDVRRYFGTVYQCMGDIATLITGASGTGKELVARAIAMSQYIPFDDKKGEFIIDYSYSLLTIHLAAMSPTLIESELFGHRKGAFTGATADRNGVFAACPANGCVFLDEIGELSPEIQVKLLRVLQNRTFQRLGDLETMRFTGKIIAATNRDFAREMQEGNFREDLYYRLCSDQIRTPSLTEQLADQPDDLHRLVEHLTKKLTGDDESLAKETVDWIDSNLGAGYSWPGNVRELEQCLRNVMIRGRYQPVYEVNRSARETISAAFLAGRFTVEELTEKYCTMIYAETGSYEEAARRLKIDRRTVKARIDQGLLDQLKKIE